MDEAKQGQPQLNKPLVNAQKRSEFFAVQQNDLTVSGTVSKILFETAIMCYFPNRVDDEQLRLNIISALTASYNFLLKYSNVTHIPELLKELDQNIIMFRNNRGFDRMQMWDIFWAERFLIMKAMGVYIGLRKQKKGNWSWMSIDDQRSEKQ